MIPRLDYRGTKLSSGPSPSTNANIRPGASVRRDLFLCLFSSSTPTSPRMQRDRLELPALLSRLPGQVGFAQTARRMPTETSSRMFWCFTTTSTLASSSTSSRFTAERRKSNRWKAGETIETLTLSM